MRARKPSSSKVSSSTAKRSSGLVKRSSYACRLCAQEATTSTTIFTKMFPQDRSSPNKSLDDLMILNGKQDPDRCYDGIARLSTDRAIHNDPAHQSTVERRSCGSAAHQNPTHASLL